MAEPSVIDSEAIENLRALNPGDNDEFLREIIGIFLEDTPQRLVELDQGLRTGDASLFVRAAHSIKGSSANVGAAALRAAAEKLEHASRTEGLKNVTGLITSVKTEFVRVRAELNKLVGK